MSACPRAAVLLAGPWVVWAAIAAAVPPGDLAFAFVSVRDGTPQVYVRDKGTEHAVTRGAPASQPAWSPDGKRLALIRYENGGTTLYLHDAAGGEARRVGSGNATEFGPSFAPDGRVLAYLTSERDGKVYLAIVDLAKDSTVRVALPGNAVSPTPPEWSADGRRLALVAADADKRLQVFVVARDGTGLKAVTKAARRVANAALAPDGRTVAYVQDMREKGVDLVVTEIESGATRNLSEGFGAHHERPRWSPDGKWIAFASSRDDPMRTRTDVFVMRPDGTDVRNLSRDPGEDFDPQWTADGRAILYTSLRTGASQVFAADVASGESVRLTQGVAQSFEQVPRPAPR